MNKEEAIKYKEYPEGSGGKRIYDSFNMPYEEYLKKYYSKPDFKRWEQWLIRYIEPAFEESRHNEMIKNFGYVSLDRHDFKAQEVVYNQLKLDDRFSEDVKKFIGFLAGAGFFKRNQIELNQWFEMKNWHNPYVNIDEGRNINEILNNPFGLNYIKELLTQMPFWRR